jgi:dihydroneopterin aldolase
MDDELPPMDDEGPGPEVDEDLAQELAQGFADVMQDVLGVAVEVEGDAAPVEDEMGDMEAEVDVAAPEGGEEAGAALDDLDAMEDEDEDPVGMRDGMYENQDKIVAEVAKRVAARLQRESRKEQMVDQLAERIMKRLTSK